VKFHPQPPCLAGRAARAGNVASISLLEYFAVCQPRRAGVCLASWSVVRGSLRVSARRGAAIPLTSQNNTPVIKLMASTMLSAAIEAVQFSASCVALLFASY